MQGILTILIVFLALVVIGVGIFFLRHPRPNQVTRISGIAMTGVGLLGLVGYSITLF